jgi:hypothetical protein
MFRQQVLRRGGRGGESRPTPKCQGQKRPWEKESGGFLEGEGGGMHEKELYETVRSPQNTVATSESTYW